VKTQLQLNKYYCIIIVVKIDISSGIYIIIVVKIDISSGIYSPRVFQNNKTT